MNVSTLCPPGFKSQLCVFSYLYVQVIFLLQLEDIQIS